MPRDHSKLTRTDARTFALLQAGPLTARQAGAALNVAANTAQRSLQRLVLHRLATPEIGKRHGFASGAAPWTWTLIPGAAFPGPAPRKRYTLQINGRPADDARRPAAITPPAIIAPPQPVTAAPTLAGTVAQQMRGKD